jgi:hypothetical protein
MTECREGEKVIFIFLIYQKKKELKPLHPKDIGIGKNIGEINYMIKGEKEMKCPFRKITEKTDKAGASGKYGEVIKEEFNECYKTECPAYINRVGHGCVLVYKKAKEQ